LDLSRTQVNEAVDNVVTTARENAWGLASGALSVTGAVGGLFAGLVISIIALFFFLRDGRTMWMWIANLLPGEKTTHRVDRAGLRAWGTLRRYAQTVIVVALVNAVGIGGVAWILGVPLVIPIAIFVFLTAFIPLLGATLAGVVAVLIALVDGGPTTAALMLVGVLVVQQLEGNVLYPWLFGKAASIHPFVILLTISAGTLTAGLVGAVIAIPILAFIYTFFVNLKDSAEEEEEDKPITAQIPVMARRGREAIRDAMHHSTSEIRVRRKDKKAPDAADAEPERDATQD
jgi:predicted PurR-regulated permease PerM